MTEKYLYKGIIKINYVNTDIKMFSVTAITLACIVLAARIVYTKEFVGAFLLIENFISVIPKAFAMKAYKKQDIKRQFSF